MRIEYLKKVNILDFEKTIGKELVVKEREPVILTAQFYCSFEDSEIQGIGVLISEYGNGSTPHEAIQDYCKLISSQTLVFNAHKPDRQEIKCPILFYTGEK